MEKITETYSTLLRSLRKKMREIVKKNDGKLTLTDAQVNDIKFYTSFSVKEIGFDDNVSGGVYFKTTSGCVMSFNILTTDYMYNFVRILAR